MAINWHNTWGQFKQQIEDLFLQKSGGNINGNVEFSENAKLTLGKSPEIDMEAVTKKYADNNIIYVRKHVNFSDTDEYVSVGRIPNFDSEKYIVLYRRDSVFSHYPPTTLVLDYNFKYTCYDDNTYPSYIYLTSDGEVRLSGSGREVTIELICLPVSKVSLIN